MSQISQSYTFLGLLLSGLSGAEGEGLSVSNCEYAELQKKNVKKMAVIVVFLNMRAR